MKHGFMLIELIVATLIASMIGGLLLTALSQETRMQQFVDTMVDSSLRVGIAVNQLEKDFMGAFIPMQARIKPTKETNGKPVADKESNQKKDTSGNKKEAQDDGKEKVAKPDEKPLEKIFYGTTKDGHFESLTFTTNNPLPGFVGSDVGVIKPRSARVQYTLTREQEKEKDSPFVLMRQESSDLDLALYTNVRGYPLIDGIKECKVTYIARIKKNDEKQKQEGAVSEQKNASPAQKTPPAKNAAQEPKKSGAAKQKIEYEYKSLTEWVSEPKEEKKEQQKQEFPRIPYAIEIKMILWNMPRTKTENFTFVFELPTQPFEAQDDNEEQDESETDTQKKSEKTTGQSATEKLATKEPLSADELVVSLTGTLGNISKMFNRL